jgi:hypothetical protein
VGTCASQEQYDPVSGDAMQRSTGGLLIWRKADNWLGFTDGSTTWINGPYGLLSRRNDQRFPWERQLAAGSTSVNAPLVPSIVFGDPQVQSYAARLRLSLVSVESQPVGQRVVLQLTNDDWPIAFLNADSYLRDAAGSASLFHGWDQGDQIQPHAILALTSQVDAAYVAGVSEQVTIEARVFFYDAQGLPHDGLLRTDPVSVTLR